MSSVTPKNNSWLMGAFLSSDLDDAGLDPYEFRVYLHFCRRVGDELRCWDSHATIAKICKISERKVRDALASLAEKNIISIEKRFRDDGSQTSNSYFVNGLPGLNNAGGVAQGARGGGAERQGGVAPRADEGIPLSVRSSNLTTISTTPSYTTTEDAPKQYADDTKAQGREEKLLERGERSTTSRNSATPTVRTARNYAGTTQQPAQAHNTKFMSSATSRKPNTTRSSEASPSDCQTTPTSPVQPESNAAEQILQAYHQTRFNKPCSDPQQVIALIAYAADLHNAGYSPAQVTKATRNAMERWSQPEHATLRAVTKHIATLLQPVESNFVRQSDGGYPAKPAYEAPIVTRDKSYKRTSECEGMNLALELQDTLDTLKQIALQKKYKR